ncbi:MAG: holo-ACP synthase [Methanocorpusculum sp.]|nr:holo-ACP synthase [Methanocorpusculum sp.]
MHIYTGTDIIDIARFTDDLIHSERFLNHCFTKAEQEYCLAKHQPAQHFAARFAAKEAVTKALSGMGKTLPYTAIEIQNRPDGRPFVNLITKDSQLTRLNIDISLSHAQTAAVAFAVVWCE